MPPKLNTPKARAGQLTPSHHRARKQEKELAVKLGGRTTPGSGNLDMKGDIRIKNIARIECKTTKHKSFPVTLEMIRKIQTAAMSAGEVPAMVIEFIDTKGKPINSVAVVPVWALENLIANSANQS